MTENDTERLYAVAEEVTFRNETTGFTVLDVSSEDGEFITVVGVLPEISPGESLVLHGTWDTHPAFGRQFKVVMCERNVPSSVSSMLKYLSSGTVKGIGPSTAVKIIEEFGEDSFKVLENHPEELAKINGISKAKAEKLSRLFNEQFADRQMMISLESLGLSPSECVYAYKAFGTSAYKAVSDNPYILCDPCIGVSFDRADDIAFSLDKKPSPEYRINAGIIHVVAHNTGNGHTCLPREKLLAPASELLSTNNDTVDIATDNLIADRQLVEIDMNSREFVFLPVMYNAEKSAAEAVSFRIKFPPAGKNALESKINKTEKEIGIKYEGLQREAIMTAVSKGILILTGGPGTGKTTTLNGIIRLFEEDDLRIALTAPTGRAAQRMSEITGRNAQTMHRLLEAGHENDGSMEFGRNSQNPIEADVLIADELSMVDILLFSGLMNALPVGCRLIMVGDSNQLPAVGPGNVLHDLIDSKLIPVVTLNEVFRQALQSTIVSNAHRIVEGRMPELSKNDNDFFHMERNDPSRALSDVVSLYTERLPKAYGYDPISDIQILCPSKKGMLGTQNLNHIIQNSINPSEKGKDEIKSLSRVFRTGDKIMQIKNDYNIVWEKDDIKGTGIFNGDIGFIKSIDKKLGIMRADFDGRLATYPLTSFSEIELAYAVTVHKSQGSEFKAVIMPVIDIPTQLRYRNLLYTAVTRAREKMITVGRASEIKNMVDNDKKIKRYSALRYFLEET